MYIIAHITSPSLGFKIIPPYNDQQNNTTYMQKNSAEYSYNITTKKLENIKNRVSYIENIYNTLLSIVLKKTKYFQINFLKLKNVHLQKTSFYFTFSQSTVQKKSG